MACRFHVSSQLLLLGLLWGSLVGVGLYQLQQFEITPSQCASAPEQFPPGLDMRQSEESPCLLVFIHPHCPCSHATIGELERLVAHAGPQLSTVVIFWHPEGVAADWHQTPLWKRTRNIPGVPVINDTGCLITRRFGVTTSGQALLYDRTGKLQFAGGITPARGHAGDNVGKDLVLSLMNADSQPSGTPSKSCTVFGCPFIDTQTMASSVEHQP